MRAANKAVKARAKEPLGGRVNLSAAANGNAVAMQQPAPGNVVRFLSVCSGIEAASVAFGPLGWQAVAFSEIEKFPSAVLAHHYPDVSNLGDFTAINTAALGRVDILCGGTPCQAFSFAGLRGSLGDARGNLTLAFVELAHALAGNRGTAGNGLRNALWENVPGVLTTEDNAFGCFLAGLVGADVPIEPPPGRNGFPDAGAVAGPSGRAAWRVLDAQYFGLAQRRRRVVVIADFGNGADPAAVLFERQGMFGNSPPRRETGEGVAGTVAASVAIRGRDGGSTAELGDHIATALRASQGGGDKPHVLAYAPEIARCVATREGKSQDYESTTMVVSATGEIAHALKAEGADGSEDGTGRGTPIVAIPIDMRQASRGATMTNNRKAGTSGGAPGTGIGDDGDPSPTIGTSRTPAVFTSAVRRLTPKECERLMGFPDDYTRIPWRKKPAADCPDGPRYKALGNSWAVPQFAWIGRRLAVALQQRIAANDNIATEKAA